MVQRWGNAGPAGTKMEDVAMVTGSTSGYVVRSTGGTGWGGCADDAGYDSLAGGVLHGANATLHLLREEPQDSVLGAVEQRLGLSQPEAHRPAESKTPIIQLKILQPAQRRSVLEESFTQTETSVFLSSTCWCGEMN